jgi:hypothetical protein
MNPTTDSGHTTTTGGQAACRRCIRWLCFHPDTWRGLRDPDDSCERFEPKVIWMKKTMRRCRNPRCDEPLLPFSRARFCPSCRLAWRRGGYAAFALAVAIRLAELLLFP